MDDVWSEVLRDEPQDMLPGLLLRGASVADLHIHL
jgi:hypothetical protein